ncbi:MAG TPA: MFS transporter [Kouleothrix sp.]|uniref:MFS transporter n=1 Tax=Kouleothrix sp. TaxID=2779161 RepID=UPI002C3DA267|nr:MFS transporter [Kouleothrix sp.]
MNKRSPMAFIFLTVFIDLLGAGIVLPLLPYYVKIIEQSESAALAENRAIIVGLLAASFSLMQFLCAPVLGALSDRFGRRPVLLISLLGTGISYIVFGLADRLLGFGAAAVLAVLFGARILDGITGGNISTAQAYIADITTPENRAKGMGMIGAAFGLGFMLGPALGGLLSGISLEAPAFAAAALALANVAFGYFMLPESLPAEQRIAVPLAKMNPLARLSGVLSNQAIRPLLAGVFMLNLAFAGMQSNFAVYSDARFGFGPRENAFIFAFIGLMAVIMQGFLIRRLVPRFGEMRLAVVGLALMAVAFTLIALAPQPWTLYPIMGLLAAGSGMATPSLTSLISRRVAPQAQGATLGGTQALNSLTMVLGPLLAGALFDVLGLQAPYFVGGLLVAGALVLIGIAVRASAPAVVSTGMPSLSPEVE